VLYLERHVPLHERIAFYTIADVAVVTATRDGMNLVPYEYVVCRQGPEGEDNEELQLPRESMLVVSGGRPAEGARGATSIVCVHLYVLLH
jgi:trehalose 6-phosphate synthase/phosphatase